MKTTLDIDDQLYRRLKAHAAMNGQSVKSVITEAIDRLLAEPPQSMTPPAAVRESIPDWVGSLSAYAKNANGKHDMASIRESIAKGRFKK